MKTTLISLESVNVVEKESKKISFFTNKERVFYIKFFKTPEECENFICLILYKQVNFIQIDSIETI